MRSSAVRLAILLAALYVFGGIIGWPGWRYLTLREGGLNYLLYSALGPYLLLTLVALGGIGLITTAFVSASSRQYSVAVRLNSYLQSPAYLGVVSLLIILAGFRLQLLGFGDLWGSQRLESSEAAERAARRGEPQGTPF